MRSAVSQLLRNDASSTPSGGIGVCFRHSIVRIPPHEQAIPSPLTGKGLASSVKCHLIPRSHKFRALFSRSFLTEITALDGDYQRTGAVRQ